MSMKVKVIDLDHKGNGIAKIDNKVVFIPKAIVGDIVDIDIVKSHKKYDEARVINILEESVDRIESLCPYYNILHEYRVIVLDNESMDFEGLNIYGLSFSIDDRGIPQLDKSMIKSDSLNIINYHVPYYWDEFSDLGFDIQLSGHTHGGQFYPAIWFTKLMFGYNMGLFRNKVGRYLHVTTGVGSMDTPMRWGTDSEIVVLKLRRL